MPVANQGPRLQAVAILFLTLSWIAVCLRCYVRAVLIKSFGSDDWLAVVSLGFYTTFVVFGFLCIRDGGGKHVYDITLSNLSHGMEVYWWIAEIFYAASTGILKFSIGAFLLRITVTRAHLYTIWTIMILVAVMTVTSVALVIFQCNPVSYFWTRYNGSGGTCIDTLIILDVAWAHSVTNAVADWALAILPVFMVWNLDLNPRSKISLAIILALGALGSCATIVRCIFVEDLADQDFLWSTIGISIWSIVEVGLGQTAASLATLKPLFVRFFSRSHLFGSETLPSTYPGLASASKRSPTRSGYTGSHHVNGSTSTDLTGLTGMIELSLREDLGKGHGVTTVINSDWKSPIEEETGFIYHGDAEQHKNLRRHRSDRVPSNSRLGLFRVGKSRSQTGLNELGLNGEVKPLPSPTWESGIRKTMVITTDTEEHLPGTAL